MLKSHLHAAPRNRYLFETRRFGPFTTRRIQQIVQGYREKAGITQPLHPHLFRHQMLTYLTSKGLTDAQIQLISGHESKKEPRVIWHTSPENADRFRPSPAEASSVHFGVECGENAPLRSAVYQHLSLESIDKAYQDAVQSVGI